MTSLTDRETSFTYEVMFYDPENGWVDFPEAVNVIPSVDMDRIPYCAIQVEFAGLSYADYMKLDPRLDIPGTGFAGNRIMVRVLEFDAAGDFRANLVRDSTFPELKYAELIIRYVDYDEITGDGTITASGRESILDDRLRIAGSGIDTGATTVISLVYWSLTDCFGSFSMSNDNILSATSIPSGDRRYMMPGESHSDLLEPELQAIGARLYDYWGDAWYGNERENTPLLGFGYGYERTLQLATYTQREGAPPNADPIVYSVRSQLSRESDYADGVLIKFDTLESGGATTYQRSGDGSNTKGRVITWQRVEPGANAADEVVQRTKIRGHSVDVTARARLDVSPGQVINVFLRDDRTMTATVRAIRWDIAAAEMTIRAQAGLPEE